MFQFGRNRLILANLTEYLDVAQQTLDHFRTALAHYAQHGADAHFGTLAHETHLLESRADAIREQTELVLYEKSLMPESREDIMRLFECLDEIPNRADDILRALVAQQTILPPALLPDITELVNLSVNTFSPVRKVIGEAFGKGRELDAPLNEIGAAETVGDQLENKIVSALFRSDLPTAEKILCRDLVLQIGSILDLADDAGFFMKVFTVKRRV